MAWNIHYQCCFTSMNGTQYAVNICEQDYSGSIVQLTGAPEPFVTQEEDDDNIFTAIRPQTGYLRVIDTTTNGDLLETIIPANNTEKMVQLLVGTITESGGNITFTPQSGNTAIKWQGFLVAEAFTQPWDKNYKMVELPVKSLLGCLDDITINKDLSGAEGRIATLFVNGIEQLYGNNQQNFFTKVICINDTLSVNTFLAKMYLFLAFLKEEQLCNENEVYDEIVGESYYNALEKCLKVFGLVAREEGTTLVLAQYDVTEDFVLRYAEMPWMSMVAISNGTVGIVDINLLDTQNLLDNISFKGVDNSVTFLPGGKSAKVSLRINDWKQRIQQSAVTADDSTVYDVYIEGYSKVIKIQPHEPTSQSETYQYLKYQRYNAVAGTYTYEDWLPYTRMLGYTMNPYYGSPAPYFMTGACPVRWYYRTQDSNIITLRDGLWLNSHYDTNYSGMGTLTIKACYSVKSAYQFIMSNGALRIYFRLNNLIFYQGDGAIVFGSDAATYMGISNVYTYMRVALRVGNMLWNGSGWTQSSDISSVNFTVPFKDTEIITNKTSSLNVDAIDGFFIPITSQMTGDVELYILNYVRVGTTYPITDTSPLISPYHIIENIDISFYPIASITAAERKENTYRRTIMLKGFTEEKEIQLDLGTNNNNKFSVSFIKDSTAVYTETMSYSRDEEGQEIYNQRPELHLLDRMVEYYNQIRRSFTGIVSIGIELMQTRYTYLNKIFFGVKSQTNWREDTQQVKFIEIN